MLHLSETILKKFDKDKDYQKVRDHCHYSIEYRGAARTICNSKFNVPNKISIVFDNGSNYDYHFIIKELENEFEGQLERPGESKEECKSFSVPIKKKITKIDKDGNKSFVNISYKIKFTDSARFMKSSLIIMLIISQKEFIKLNVKVFTVL